MGLRDAGLILRILGNQGQLSMKAFGAFLAAAAAGLGTIGGIAWPAFAQDAAQDTSTDNAENLRKLEIMLMVTALRCRNGADNFQAEYRDFTVTHSASLSEARQQLRGRLVHRHGGRGATKALDQISVGMANQYGQGHPWLGCAQLKMVALDLSRQGDVAQLSLAASELLSQSPQGRWAGL